MTVQRRRSPGRGVRGSDEIMMMVGMAGFEPTTTCTPSRCATRLRYIPTRRRRSDPSSIIALQESQDFPKLLAHLAEGGDAVGAAQIRRIHGRAVGGGDRRLHTPRHLRFQALLRARDGESLFIEELLDAKHGLD